MPKPRLNIVPWTFCLLSLAGIYFSGMNPVFVINEVVTRFVRDGILVLSLIIPVNAGMGLNFAMIVGAICAQVGTLIVLDRQIAGFSGLFLSLLIGLGFSVLMGFVIGWCLNRVRGKEMITTIIIGFIATGIYQFCFMFGYGTFIEPHNPEMILSKGIGIRNMVDLAGIRNLLENIWRIRIGPVDLPLFLILTVLCFALLLYYLARTPLGQQIRAVGEHENHAQMIGIPTQRIRILAMILSLVMACCGHILYIQNIGMLNVYTAHLNNDIFSCAALLAGGATVHKAGIRNAFLGIFLFHALFVVSPQAGQNLFGNPALGEYFRSFVAYATIAFALVMTQSKKDQ